MSIVGALSAAGSILGGISGLFGKKKGAPSARENIMKAAQGARQAQEAYGFNPLTMLSSAAAGGGGGGGGGPAPLASIELITGGLKELDDIKSGDAERRRQMDQKNIELAQIKLDQLRSGVIVHRDNAVDRVGAGLSPIGRNNATFTPNRSAVPVSRGMAANPIAGDREVERAKLTNSPGVYEIENAITNGPVTIPGDGEPMGIDEVATAAIFGLPQIAYNTWFGKGAKAKWEKVPSIPGTKVPEKRPPKPRGTGPDLDMFMPKRKK